MKKISADQLRQLVDKLPEMFGLLGEIEERLSKTPVNKFDAISVGDKPVNEAFEEGALLAMAYSLFRTIESIATYGRSISNLLKETRDTGSHESLFKAIRMDRATIGCPTAMQHIAKAQMRGNSAFFKRLRSAIARPSKKEWRGLDRMRCVFLLLREMGIGDLSKSPAKPARRCPGWHHTCGGVALSPPAAAGARTASP